MGLCGVVTERVVPTPMVPHWKNVNITAKELTPIIMAAILWGHHWTGNAVLFCCDNQAIVHCIQSGSSSKQPQEGQLLRCLFMLAACHYFHPMAKHTAEHRYQPQWDKSANEDEHWLKKARQNF